MKKIIGFESASPEKGLKMWPFSKISKPKSSCLNIFLKLLLKWTLLILFETRHSILIFLLHIGCSQGVPFFCYNLIKYKYFFVLKNKNLNWMSQKCSEDKGEACSCQYQDGQNASSTNLVELYYIKPRGNNYCLPWYQCEMIAKNMLRTYFPIFFYDSSDVTKFL